jgi:methylated-DNA-[protein]-cysteine S-methyltransferase
MTKTKRRTAYYDLVDTAIGEVLVAGDGKTLVATKFNVDERKLPAAVEALYDELHGAFDLVRDGARVRELTHQMRDYLDGKRATFDVTLELSWLTPFRREVMLETQRVPRGEVATYRDIAVRVGRPNAYRAVGNTMRTNPLPIVVPCHRIVGSDGSLTGFGGGLPMKRQLLAIEGARID